MALISLLTAGPVLAEVPSVVTDIPPVHSLTAQVMGDLGAPYLLLGAGSDPHDLQLRPSQARALAEAELVFWVGTPLTPWLGDTMADIGVGGRAVELIAAEQTRRRSLAPAGASDSGAPARPEETDPHAWLDPENARAWVAVIAGALSEADPENAATYAANAKAAGARIDAAEAETRALLAPARGAGIVMYHDAYGYFSEAFDLPVAGTIAGSDAESPSAARLAEIRDMLGARAIACIFPETQREAGFVANVVAGTETRVGAPLDPSGALLQTGPQLYADLLAGMAQAIADCVTAEN